MTKKAKRSGAKTTSPTQVVVSGAATAVDASSGILVAVELSGEWPSLTMTGSERRVLVQLEGEAPLAFAERVTSGLDALFGRGVELRTRAVCCNERLDGAADEARRHLIGLTLGAMAQRRAGQVVLAAAPRASARLRGYLEALAASARREWQSAGLEVSVDFGHEAPRAATTLPHARVA
jgi:hypothetical protein